MGNPNFGSRHCFLQVLEVIVELEVQKLPHNCSTDSSRHDAMSDDVSVPVKVPPPDLVSGRLQDALDGRWRQVWFLPDQVCRRLSVVLKGRRKPLSETDGFRRLSLALPAPAGTLRRGQFWRQPGGCPSGGKFGFVGLLRQLHFELPFGPEAGTKSDLPRIGGHPLFDDVAGAIWHRYLLQNCPYQKLGFATQETKRLHKARDVF
jgi:hypothetical protein